MLTTACKRCGEIFNKTSKKHRVCDKCCLNLPGKILEVRELRKYYKYVNVCLVKSCETIFGSDRPLKRHSLFCPTHTGWGMRKAFKRTNVISS